MNIDWDNEGKFQWQSGDVWEPEHEGDELKGVVITKETGQFGHQWKIETPDGDQILTPAHKHLQTRMRKAQSGQVVRIVYSREKQTGKGNPMQLYRVGILRETLRDSFTP